MAFNKRTVANAREWLEYVQRISTCKYVSAVAVNAGGTGYTAGDVLTITHAGAHQDCKFVVGTVNGSGAVLTISRIEENGAFANRLTAATVTAGNAGAGYSVGDVVGLLGGTTTSPAKMQVSGVGGGGAVTTLSVFEGGGHYSSAPSNGASTDSGIGTGSGTGLKVDVTFSSLIGTTGIGATGGTGTGATFNLTLADAGWSVLRSVNDYSFNSVADEKEVVLQGTGGTGSANPIVGFRTGTDGGGPARAFVSISPMTAYSGGLSYDSQPNILNPVPGTSGGQYVQLNPAGGNVTWFSISPRRIGPITSKTAGGVTNYHQSYVGLMNQTGTVVESPNPMVVFASCSSISVSFDDADESDVSGISECFKRSTRAGPCFMWSQPDLDWKEVKNGEASGTGPPFTVTQDRGVFPIFKPRLNFEGGTASKGNTVADGPCSFHSTIGRADGGTATHTLKPTPDSGGAKQAMIPLHVLHSLDVAGQTEGGVDGVLDNCYWISGRKSDGSIIAAEDTFTFGGQKWIAFPNGHRALAYSFMAVEVGK